MTNIIHQLTIFFQFSIALTMIPFVYLQWKVRHRNGIVKRLRHHIIWETMSLVLLFLTAGIFDHHETIVLLATFLVLATFISGTRMFLIIHNGSYEKHPPVEPAGKL